MFDHFVKLALKRLTLYTVEIFCNSILIKIIGLGLELKKYLNYLAGLALILLYIGIRLEKYSGCLIGSGLIL